MIYGIYSMRDAKTGFTSLTLDQNDDAAARNFSHAVLSSDGLLRSYSQDFALYHLGTFDTDTGKMAVDPLPSIVIDGAQVTRQRDREVSHD